MTVDARPVERDIIPSGALCIQYTASNRKKGTYYIWKRSSTKFQGEECWYWYALGYGGEEYTAYEATKAARNWITNGVASLSRSKTIGNYNPFV